MAKAAKPEFLHAPAAANAKPHGSQKSTKRKRMARQTGEYIDPRGSRRGAMRDGMRITDARWRNIISAIANGKTWPEAAKIGGVTVQSIDAYLISNISAYKQLRDATLIWNRVNWPAELIEQIFNDLAIGMTLKAAAVHNGVDAKRMPALYKLVRHDKQIREHYDDARQLQAESFFDEIIDIADDSSRDRLENGRVNHEVVNRSKLKIETRRFAMGSMVKKRFGDHKHVELDGNVTFNHIAMLTGARKRLETLQTKRQLPATIENETGEVAEV